MPYIVTEFCIQCEYIDCVAVCPMDYPHADPSFLVIDPDECTDCSIYVLKCPAGAIYPAVEMPADQQNLIALNVQLSRRADWPRLTKVQAPL